MVLRQFGNGGRECRKVPTEDGAEVVVVVKRRRGKGVEEGVKG